MPRFPVKTVVQAAIPAALLAIFALAVSFPSRVPFLSLKIPKSPGLGSFNVSVPGFPEGIAMMEIPAGSAPGGTMNVPDAVRVERPFALSRTEVSDSLYRAVRAEAERLGYDFGANPAAGEGAGSLGGYTTKAGGENEKVKNDTLPAEGISWAAAVVWCNALSEACSLEPVYRYPDDSRRVVRSLAECLILCGQTVGGPAMLPEAAGFRIPSSDEWEFAARYRDGRSWTPGSWPSGGSGTWTEQSRADLVAVYNRSSPAPVASVGSNALGIYDMSGNVWEWCFDPFTDAVQATGSENKRMLPSKRVTRGGSWMAYAWRIQIGGAFGTLPDVSERGQGFRLALDGPRR